MGYCVNCGIQIKTDTNICPKCYFDPRVPVEAMDAFFRNPYKNLKYNKSSFPEFPGETSSLWFAIILSLLIGFLLSLFTIGTFLLLLLLGLIYLRVKEWQIKSNLLRISEKNYPELYNISKVAAYRLDIPLPPIYIENDLRLNAYTSGFGGSHWIVLNSGLLKELSLEELLFVLGHEMGHIKKEHTTWLNLISPSGSYYLPLVSDGLRIIFNNWSLKAEYTADRAGLIAERKVEPCICALGKLMGIKEDIDMEVLLREFERKNQDPLYKISEYFGDHPFIPNRIKQLLQFSKYLGGQNGREKKF